MRVDLMTFITEEFIKSFYPDNFFKRGKKYYRDGHVHNLHYNHEEGVWDAEVRGSKSYNVSVLPDPDDRSLMHYCSCPAFPTYGSCKHTCAALFAVADARQQNMQFFEEDDSMNANTDTRGARYRQAQDLINYFDDIQDTSSKSRHKRVLKMEYELETFVEEYFNIHEESFDIRLKVGTDRLYIVKDIPDFFKKYQ